jgi:hypothetical protein
VRVPAINADRIIRRSLTRRGLHARVTGKVMFNVTFEEAVFITAWIGPTDKFLGLRIAINGVLL